MTDYTPTYVKRSVTDYAKLLLRLFPMGRVWSRNEDGVLYKLCAALGSELLRVDDRMGALLYERDSRNTNELIQEFETDLGLPDACSELGATLSDRQAAVHAKLIAEGEINKQAYIDYASSFGFTIAITEYTPFICGVHGCGDSIGDNENFFYWRITPDYTSSTLESFLTMMCVFESIKPAHTIIIWDLPFELSLSATDPSFTEGDAPVSLFNGVSVTSPLQITGMTISVTGVLDDNYEYIGVDGSFILLSDGQSGNTATNSISYSVSVSGGVYTVSFTGASLSSSEFEAVVSGVSYNNDSPIVANGARSVTISSVTNEFGTFSQTATSSASVSTTISTFDYIGSFDTALSSQMIAGFDISPSFDTFSVTGVYSDNIYQYSLSDGDITTSAFVLARSMTSSLNNAMRGLSFSDNGTKMFVASSENTNNITKHSLQSPYVPYNSLIESSSLSFFPKGMTISEDGTKVVCGGDPASIYFLSMSTPYSLATLTDDGSLSGPYSVANISSDGKYIIWINGNNLYYSELTTAWDRTTVQSPVLVGELETPVYSYNSINAKKYSDRIYYVYTTETTGAQNDQYIRQYKIII